VNPPHHRVNQPETVLNWQNKLARASVDDTAYAKALATELQWLVCANDIDAIHILRGIIYDRRLRQTNREAPRLVDLIMSKECPVSASLTDGDKAELLKVKQDAEQYSAPLPESKKDK
jgi:hypothetical protein